MKPYKLASFAGALAMTAISVAAVAETPQLKLTPVAIGQETARYEKGVATVSLATPAGAVEVRAQPLRDGRTLSFSVAVYNKSTRAANFGTENISATFDGVPVRVLTAEELSSQATQKARSKQLLTGAIAGVVAGIASTASTTHTGYQYVHTRHHGNYVRPITWQDNTIGTVGAVAAAGVGVAAIKGIDNRLDYTLEQIGTQTLQTTTVDKDSSIGGLVTIALGKELGGHSGTVRLTIDWNGQRYPLAFRLSPPGSAAQMPATQQAAMPDPGMEADAAPIPETGR